jgi:hypothetical protein
MNQKGNGDKRRVESRRAPNSPSPALPREFEFIDSPANFRDPQAIIVRIPRGIRSRQKLFAIYASTLRFPKYFGWNWDAFEECLRDLSWLPLDKPAVVVHEELPFGAGGDNRRVYFEVLRDVLESHASQKCRTLRIIMPATAKDST